MTELSLTPPYPVRCVLCSGALYPVVLDYQSAPWMCVICRHAWWVAELQVSARAQYRSSTDDFGLGAPMQAIKAAVEAERTSAQVRGTSCRADQLALVPLIGLQYLARLPLDPPFMAQVETELQRKSG